MYHGSGQFDAAAWVPGADYDHRMKTGPNRRVAAIGWLLWLSGALCACASAKPQACSPADAKPGAALSCELPGFAHRPYDVHLPADYVPARPVPVVLAIHGGGGNSRGAARTTCPGGDIESRDCLHAIAGREGVAVVYPNGTGARLLANVRTWNAGGGEQGWQCVSGRACKDGVDDIAYFRALLADLARWVALDPRRVYATGLSNGGAMSHRLACQMAGRIAAIAALGGENQYATTATCAPARPVPVLQIHGTRDPCWRYAGGTAACAQRDDMSKISVEESMRIWAALNGCQSVQAAQPAAQPMASEDGIVTERVRWAGCRAQTELIRVVGGGHVWPGGWAYLPEGVIGPMVRGWSANRVILDFFRRNPMAQ
jgi:polyhydroxybutyrate depolymerase